MRVVTTCRDLDAAMAFYGEIGLRLDMIMPADGPRLALMSAPGLELRIEVDGAEPVPVADTSADVLIMRAGGGWVTGRAGMRYRDLIPGRLGGGVIASQIRIPDGGPVPDYVHYHRIGFQMIYCRRGWVRVVYEDQGPPFVMNEGDCVLQPPTIRHRVLDSSPGLEVIEVSAPAEHETWRDHGLELPTSGMRPERVYGGQRFVRHVAAEAGRRSEDEFEVRDSGIARASDGAGSVRVLRTGATPVVSARRRSDQLQFLMALAGHADIRGDTIGRQALDVDEACAIPPGASLMLEVAPHSELLEVLVAL